MQGALLDRLVYPRDQRAMLLGDRRGVAVGCRLLETPKMGLHGTDQAPVLVMLAGGS